MVIFSVIIFLFDFLEYRRSIFNHLEAKYHKICQQQLQGISQQQSSVQLYLPKQLKSQQNQLVNSTLERKRFGSQLIAKTQQRSLSLLHSTIRMKEKLQFSYLNLSESMYENQDTRMANSQKFNRDLRYESLRPQLNHFENSHFCNFQDHIVTSLERNRLITHHDQFSKYINDSPLFPQNGMSHKRYIAEIEGKLFDKYPKEQKFCFNHSAALYPYSFTEYERMKQKMQEKKLAEDKWLENQILRIRKQDQLIEAKQKIRKKNQTSYMPLKIQQKKKVKQIFKEVREQLKLTNIKTNDSNNQAKQKANKKFYLDHSFLEENSRMKNKQQNNLGKLSNSQVFSSDSKSKKFQRREQERRAAIKDMMSRHFPKQSVQMQNQEPKHRKSVTTDRYKYVSKSNLENNSILKSQYLNRYNYLFERQKKNGRRLKTELQNQKVTDEMIDKAFAFDQLKQCESNFQEDSEEQKSIERNQQREYKNSLQVLYEKLHRTPERQKIRYHQFQNHSQKQNKKSKFKNAALQNDLLVQREPNQILSKEGRKPSKFSKYVIYKSEKQLNRSLDPLSSETKDYKQSKILQSSFSPEEMQIYNRSSEQHYPIFSPYSQHKHLPHETHEYMTASLERKKLTKHWGAFESSKKQTLFKHPNHLNVKDLIVDQIEKKKIMNKLQKNQFTSSQKDQHHIEIIETTKNQRQEHHNSGTHHYQNFIGYAHQSSDFIVKNLKIQLEILRQQLEEKNKKVVDLELQLMQIKNSFVQKRQQKQDLSTSTKSKLLNEDSRKDVYLSKDQQCQAVNKNLELSHHIINEMVLPDENSKKQKLEELFRTKSQVKRLEEKLAIQEEAMGNFFEDIAMYQNLNTQLENKIKILESQRNQK